MTELQTILAKDVDGKFALWACRGTGKGCTRNKYRSSLKPCDDCFGPLPEDMTLEQVAQKLQKGEA